MPSSEDRLLPFALSPPEAMVEDAVSSGQVDPGESTSYSWPTEAGGNCGIEIFGRGDLTSRFNRMASSPYGYGCDAGSVSAMKTNVPRD